ncbi:MAG TPA: hypothetical protein PK528_13800, partial [Syntrophorhabdus sp.]|nr:hypothetical protein [Syntrophorhabdus sp.]
SGRWQKKRKRRFLQAPVVAIIFKPSWSDPLRRRRHCQSYMADHCGRKIFRDLKKGHPAEPLS